MRSQDLAAASGVAPVQDTLVTVADDVQMVRARVRARLTPQSRTELQLQATQQSSDAAIDQRSEQVAEIAQSITELADLFKDLSALVIDQGTLFDRIDYNVEQMATNVRQAATELETATRYQKRSGKRSLLFLLLLLVIGALLALVYKPR